MEISYITTGLPPFRSSHAMKTIVRYFLVFELCKKVVALIISDEDEEAEEFWKELIEKAQKKIEGNNFGIRRNLLEYDQRSPTKYR